MKIKKSFLIRWFLSIDEEQQQERSVIDVEYIQSGEKTSVSSIEEAGEWMTKITQDDYANEHSSPE